MKRYVLLGALLLPFAAVAQDILIYGRVTAQETREPLPEANIVLKLDGHKAVTVVADSMGQYAFTVDYGKVMTVEYSADGRQTKYVLVDARNLPDLEVDPGYGMNVDVKLFIPQPGMDLDFLKEPLGRAAYSPADSTINWDMEYTAPRLERLNALFPEP